MVGVLEHLCHGTSNRLSPQQQEINFSTAHEATNLHMVRSMSLGQCYHCVSECSEPCNDSSIGMWIRVCPESTAPVIFF